jgi:hypothetical protein
MAMRGIRKPGSITVTSAVRGGFKKDGRTRGEAMTLKLGTLSAGANRLPLTEPRRAKSKSLICKGV